MRILLVARMFDGVAGGLERSATKLLNEMVHRGHDVHLLTLDIKNAKCYFPLDNNITWHCLDLGDPKYKADTVTRFRRMYHIRKIVKKISPTAVIAFQISAFQLVALSLMMTGFPVIAGERDPPHRFFIRYSWFSRNLFFFSFILANKIVLQMPNYKDVFPPYLRRRIVIIPNPVFAAKGIAEPQGGEGPYILLSVGRLEYQKNMQVLVKAFSYLAEEFPDWVLRIAGEGEERKEIEELIYKHRLKDRVSLLGNVEDVEKEYISAHLFCLTSRWEGFPNALVEAFAHGLPAVGFAECAGLNELIRTDENGLLAKGYLDPKTLADSLRVLMADKNARQRYGTAAVSVVDLYRPDKVYDKWEALFSIFSKCSKN